MTALACAGSACSRAALAAETESEAEDGPTPLTFKSSAPLAVMLNSGWPGAARLCGRRQDLLLFGIDPDTQGAVGVLQLTWIESPNTAAAAAAGAAIAVASPAAAAADAVGAGGGAAAAAAAGAAAVAGIGGLTGDVVVRSRVQSSGGWSVQTVVHDVPAEDVLIGTKLRK